METIGTPDPRVAIGSGIIAIFIVVCALAWVATTSRPLVREPDVVEVGLRLDVAIDLAKTGQMQRAYQELAAVKAAMLISDQDAAGHLYSRVQLELLTLRDCVESDCVGVSIRETMPAMRRVLELAKILGDWRADVLTADTYVYEARSSEAIGCLDEAADAYENAGRQFRVLATTYRTLGRIHDSDQAEVFAADAERLAVRMRVNYAGDTP